MTNPGRPDPAFERFLERAAASLARYGCTISSCTVTSSSGSRTSAPTSIPDNSDTHDHLPDLGKKVAPHQNPTPGEPHAPDQHDTTR